MKTVSCRDENLDLGEAGSSRAISRWLVQWHMSCSWMKPTVPLGSWGLRLMQPELSNPSLSSCCGHGLGLACFLHLFLTNSIVQKSSNTTRLPKTNGNPAPYLSTLWPLSHLVAVYLGFFIIFLTDMLILLVTDFFSFGPNLFISYFVEDLVLFPCPQTHM